jgi:ubiquinone biosynthesis protein
MAHPRQLFRLSRIARVFIRHGLDEFVDTLHLFRPYRTVLRLLPWRWWRPADDSPRGVRLREALEELGPVFVKFGQVLSTRPDLLAEDLATELAKLQDQVAPFSGDQAKLLVEQAYGDALEDHLRNFNAEPVAAASVAQVHLAELLDGTEVIVKVLRPDIDEVIARDLDLLYALAGLAEQYWDEGPRLRPVEVVGEFDKTIHDELDLRREAANASQLRANFIDSEIVYVPKVYWEHTRQNVMVMERIHGIPIRDVDAIRKAGIDMRQLAHNGVEIFFTQAFRDGFFHADMHPGNIFVSEDGQYRAVDFGIVGTLSDSDKRYLAENFLAFFNRDYHAVADAHLRAGWVPPHTRVEEFEAAIRTVCEPIFAKPINEISFGRFVLQLFQVARRFEMPIQPQLVLLQKTLLNIEGLGRQLYPQLDLWETAKPYLEDWMNRQVGPRAFVEGIKKELPKWNRILPQVPSLAYDVMRKLSEAEFANQSQSAEIEKLRREISAGQRRQFVGMVGAILVLSAFIVSALDGYAPVMFHGAPLLSWAVGSIGAVLLVLAWPDSR